jgi:glycosyltransferase involved in cell wall biosynthesis
MKEGWGITNIEANACGTPVISSNVPGLRDSVKSGQSGLLYEYNNIEQLSNSIINVLTDNELREKLNTGSLEWAAQFSWDKSAEMMIDVIYQTIEQFNAKR